MIWLAQHGAMVLIYGDDYDGIYHAGGKVGSLQAIRGKRTLMIAEIYDHIQPSHIHGFIS